MECLGDLHREFSGRHENEHFGVVGSAVTIEALQRGQRERCGLSCSGCRLAEQVSAVNEWRDRFALNRCWFLVAQLGKCGQELTTELQICKAGALVGVIRSDD
jgi:hypothetical protein